MLYVVVSLYFNVQLDVWYKVFDLQMMPMVLFDDRPPMTHVSTFYSNRWFVPQDSRQ